MSADFKSHILSRDEKGFAGIPFKRLLLGGVVGGLAYTVFRLTLPGAAIPAGIVTLFTVILLTGLRGGLPLWMRLWLSLRGWLLIQAASHPKGVIDELARLINLNTALARLSGEAAFASLRHAPDVDLREWATFARPHDLDRGDGLVFVDAPLQERIS